MTNVVPRGKSVTTVDADLARGVIDSIQAARPSAAIDKAASFVLACSLALLALSIFSTKPKSFTFWGLLFSVPDWRTLGFGLVLTLIYFSVKLILEFTIEHRLSEKTAVLNGKSSWDSVRRLEARLVNKNLDALALEKSRSEYGAQVEKIWQWHWGATEAISKRQRAALDAEGAGTLTESGENPLDVQSRLSKENEDLDAQRDSKLKELGAEPEPGTIASRVIVSRTEEEKLRRCMEQATKDVGFLCKILRYRLFVDLIIPIACAVIAFLTFLRQAVAIAHH